MKKAEYAEVLLRFTPKYKIDFTSGCWVWIAGVNKYGYGHIMLRNPKRMGRAHRVAYEMFKDKIPRGKMVLHTCDNRACVNPEHLTLGDQFDNMRHCIERKRFCEGMLHWRATLTEQDIRTIRTSTLSRAELAALFKVSKNHIGDIIRRRYWMRLP